MEVEYIGVISFCIVIALLLQVEGVFLSPVPHIVSKLNTFCLEL